MFIIIFFLTKKNFKNDDEATLTNLHNLASVLAETVFIGLSDFNLKETTLFGEKCNYDNFYFIEVYVGIFSNINFGTCVQESIL